MRRNRNVCPGLNAGTPFSGVDNSVPTVARYKQAFLSNLNIESVFNDLYKLITNSRNCWPADVLGGKKHYGGLMIRLAWHCSGSYRNTDGKGGCAGGRIRLSPEASWPDNTNLDKARSLLAPIKRKYGDSLSWGDLMIFAGAASIIDMGGPIGEVCGGRIDEPDGTNSEGLNDQSSTGCPPGTDPCPEPFGAVNVGLIYVNPEGPGGKPDPKKSAERIRLIFNRMGMNDIETVALIGGGHTFGKCHGACPLGAGPNPSQQPRNPWPGNCGNGRGENTFTSGIELQWTSTPFKWSNEFFKQLIYDNFTLFTGPGGKYQWKNNNGNGNGMLTTDLALVYDEKYKEISKKFADDNDLFRIEFAKAWQRLTTNGRGWLKVRKCISAEQLMEARKKYENQNEETYDDYSAIKVENNEKNNNNNNMNGF